jgi:DMSO/TMAO reductase YedYZ heme-binding membrane subunit
MRPSWRARGVLADCRLGTPRRTAPVPVSHRRLVLAAAGITRPGGARPAVAAALLASGTGSPRADGAAAATVVLAGLQRFLLTYAGVFALVALTAAVAAGLAATDRLVITPAGRVTCQAVHRALSLAAVGFLASHVLLEVLAHRSRAIDAVVPFLAGGRTFYLGLGTLAADLIVLIALTGVMRGRFVAHWTRAWRGVHVTAYLCWPLAILHGLLGGRPAKPYVDWSYGACVAAVALALLVRFAAGPRRRPAPATLAVPDQAAPVLPPAMYYAAPPLLAQPPARLALPGADQDDGTRYGIVYGVVEDGPPQPPELP